MAYATTTDLTTFSIPSGALTGISGAKQDAALEAASRLADGYLNARYQLPLVEYGSDLKRAVSDIAAFILMKGRGFDPESADANMLLGSHNQAIKWLEGIAAGKVSPYGLRDSATTATNTEDAPETQRAPFVVQLQEGSAEEEGFWKESSSASGGTISRPKRRGW